MKSLLKIYSFIALSTSSLANASEKEFDMVGFIEKLNAKGYTNLHEIECKGNEFEVEGYNQEGRKYKLHIDSKKMEIPNMKDNDKHLTMLEVVKKAEAKGYKNFVKIKLDDDKYKIAAHDENNNKVILKVDPKSGAMKESPKDWMERIENKFKSKAADKESSKLKEMSCKDFLGVDEIYKPGLIYWVVGNNDDKNSVTVAVSVGEVENMIPFIVEDCKKNEEASFWQRVKAAFKKL